MYYMHMFLFIFFKQCVITDRHFFLPRSLKMLLAPNLPLMCLTFHLNATSQRLEVKHNLLSSRMPLGVSHKCAVKCMWLLDFLANKSLSIRPTYEIHCASFSVFFTFKRANCTYSSLYQDFSYDIWWLLAFNKK